MGYFAVLAQDPDKSLVAHLNVDRLHVNLWGLRGMWPGRRLLFLDVGIELSLHATAPDDAKISAVEMLLPFRVEEGRWKNGAPVAQDLYDSVIDEHSGSLIFGSPVSAHSAHGRSTVAFEGTQLNVGRIVEKRVKSVKGHLTKADSSLYTVPLQHPIKKGESVYFRLRWRVFGGAPLWRRTWLEPGIRVDFRVCDTREGIPSERDPSFLTRILEVASAHVFVMAPGRLRPTNVSPTPKHTRTLEPGAWLKYLDGAAGWTWMARDLLVYGWHRRVDPDKPSINEDDPFRVFLALTRPSGTPGWLHITYAAVGVLMALGLINLLQSLSDFSVRDLNVTSWLSIVGVTSIVGALTFIQKVRTFAANRARRPRILIRRGERFLLKL